ncbi:unnamed protein product [Staurois parvus]|uniref:Uncharacterized protein n=1 Tax=Staurois parvus TaxID=386267 RepID=A0ABN9EQA4_9NEOB|nr:unnamed protein product [Staurois parvus]
MDRGEFVTDREQENGRLVLERSGIKTRLGCRVCWSKKKDDGQDLGKCLQMLVEAEG